MAGRIADCFLFSNRPTKRAELHSVDVTAANFGVGRFRRGIARNGFTGKRI
jgi:hypothetical protein